MRKIKKASRRINSSRPKDVTNIRYFRQLKFLWCSNSLKGKHVLLNGKCRIMTVSQYLRILETRCKNQEFITSRYGPDMTIYPELEMLTQRVGILNTSIHNQWKYSIKHIIPKFSIMSGHTIGVRKVCYSYYFPELCYCEMHFSKGKAVLYRERLQNDSHTHHLFTAVTGVKVEVTPFSSAGNQNTLRQLYAV